MRITELGSDYYVRPDELWERPGNVLDYLAGFGPLYVDSGRSALRLLDGLLQGGKVLLPEYICESVIDSFGCDRVDFYRILPDLRIDLEDLADKMDGRISAVFLMHYFGVVQELRALSLIDEARKAHGFLVIEDSTHCLLSRPRAIGDYCVASLRKWLPVPQGGALYARDPKALPDSAAIGTSRDNDRLGAMLLKSLWLDGALDCNAEYRRRFADAEGRLDRSRTPLAISDLAMWMLRCFSVSDIAEKRRRNYALLAEALGAEGIRPICSIGDGEVPLSFPMRAAERDRFRAYLASRRIYCAVHWPDDPYMDERRPLARDLARTAISLPIDQRYGPEEMEYLIDAVRGYEGGLA